MAGGIFQIVGILALLAGACELLLWGIRRLQQRAHCRPSPPQHEAEVERLRQAGAL